MQPSYPYWSLTASGADESAVVLEVRVEIGAGGGLTGLEDESAVIQAIAGLLTPIEGATVRITETSLHNDAVPVP